MDGAENSFMPCNEPTGDTHLLRLWCECVLVAGGTYFFFICLFRVY